MGDRSGIPSWARVPSVRRAAFEYARAAHAGQCRKVDGEPFILHACEVASLLSDAGAPDHLIAAGALHDVIEKTEATESDLRERFGCKIAALVAAVSENEHISSYTARKAALRDEVARAGDEALMLFAADKISKARELHLGGAVVIDRAHAASPTTNGASRSYRSTCPHRRSWHSLGRSSQQGRELPSAARPREQLRLHGKAPPNTTRA
jgi:hypothetical protein